jgi:uncharacterized protein YeeX (DUF496 family)
MTPRYCPFPPIDSKIIEDNNDQPAYYVSKVIGILQHDKRSLTSKQLITFFEKANYTDNKVEVVKKSGPFLSDFSKEAMVELVKKAPYSTEKVAVVEQLYGYLPPGMSYQEKMEVVSAMTYQNEKDQAKKFMENHQSGYLLNPAGNNPYPDQPFNPHPVPCPFDQPIGMPPSGPFCTFPPIDSKIIEDNNDQPSNYVSKVIGILQHDKRSLTSKQLITFFEKANYTDNKVEVLKKSGPFLSDFSKEAMVELIKKAPYSTEKVAVVEQLYGYLPPGMSYQERLEIVNNMQYQNEKDAAKKLLQL